MSWVTVDAALLVVFLVAVGLGLPYAVDALVRLARRLRGG